MKRTLQLGSIWRILRETDLEAIKREAERRFRVVVSGDDPREAERIAGLLSAVDGSAVHPWLSVCPSPIGPETLRDLGEVDLAVLVSSEGNLAGPLHESRQTLAGSGVPVVTVVIGGTLDQTTAAVPHHGEAARATVAVLDSVTLAREIVPALLRAVPPSLQLALGRQLPPLRPRLFERLIAETSRANAGYSFSTGIAEIVPGLGIPLNLGDLAILTKNQLVMGYKIALVAGKQGEPRELVGEILGVLGGGFLFRQVARQLVGLVPVAGIVPKVAVAYAGTWAIGRAIVLWATEGERVSPETVRRFYDEALARGKQVARTLVAGARRGRTAQLPRPEDSAVAQEGRPGLWRRVLRRLPFRRRR